VNMFLPQYLSPRPVQVQVFHASPFDRVRELLRRGLRQIVGAAFFSWIAMGLLLQLRQPMPVLDAFLFALILCVPVGIALWFAYHFVKFVIG